MKEVVRADDPRLAALIARQATQYADDDQIGLDRLGRRQRAGDQDRRING